MAVKFHIPGPLRAYTGGRSQVDVAVPQGTLRDALQALWAVHPGLRDRLATEQGNIREHINIFVGDENARSSGGLSMAVPDGAEISIIPAISGGRHSCLCLDCGQAT